LKEQANALYTLIADLKEVVTGQTGERLEAEVKTMKAQKVEDEVSGFMDDAA
jgi:hypothetical protein